MREGNLCELDSGGVVGWCIHRKDDRLRSFGQGADLGLRSAPFPEPPVIGMLGVVDLRELFRSTIWKTFGAVMEFGSCSSDIGAGGPRIGRKFDCHAWFWLQR